MQIAAFIVEHYDMMPVHMHVTETPRVVISRIQKHDMRDQGLDCENSLSSLPARSESHEMPPSGRERISKASQGYTWLFWYGFAYHPPLGNQNPNIIGDFRDSLNRLSIADR